MIPYDPRNLEGYGDGHEDGYCAGVQDGVRSERARVRREEVEPLREALKAAAVSLANVGAHVPWEAAHTALRAADERGK